MLSVLLLPLLLSSAQCLEIAPRSGGECGCDIIKFTSQNPYILRKYEAALGLYNRVAGVEVGGRAVWLHNNENYFLYFSNASAMWAVGEVLGGDEATIENLGDTDLCPDQVSDHCEPCFMRPRLFISTFGSEVMKVGRCYKSLHVANSHCKCCSKSYYLLQPNVEWVQQKVCILVACFQSLLDDLMDNI